jgi:nucleoside-diphosphate-sugar epimerase
MGWQVRRRRSVITHILMKVLVTGASGFIGRNCVFQLQDKGYEVHALSRTCNEKRNDYHGVHWHQIDLFDSAAVKNVLNREQPTHLLHFAWYAEPGKYWTSAENFEYVRASLDLVQTFAQQGGRRVVIAGTCAEYDWRYGWCSESITPLAPSTIYGTCKNSLQQMTAIYGRQFGLSSAWGRIFFLYGPNESPSRLISSVIRSILRGEPALCSSGEQVRDFLHVSDVAAAFVALLNSDLQGAVNIASGEANSLKDVVTQIALKLGRPELLKLGARPTSPQDPPLLLADVRRLKEELGWQPAFDLDHGLDDTIAWWRKQLACV